MPSENEQPLVLPNDFRSARQLYVISGLSKFWHQLIMEICMQIRQLTVTRFRGMASLDWKPGSSFCCLIGAGDSGKSTILDAVEALLSARWVSFSEADFFQCDSSQHMVIEATIGELCKALKSDGRFGLYIRGWTSNADVRDEPQDEDEPVLTIRLTVDATMEPVWELVCDRIAEPRLLSNRDRLLFGLVRLAGDDARQLTWGQGSILSRLTGDSEEAASRLATAYRAARDSANLENIPALNTAAQTAQTLATGLGAYVEGAYKPGLELGRSGLSSGSIALYDEAVPLRLAGLGTRRLATLGIQKSAISDGAIVLVDEIEHGLEPHRIIGAIAQLKVDQAAAAAAGTPVGQILLTTHSDVALAEAGAAALRVVHARRPGRATSIHHPADPNKFRPLLRFTPRALFARRILVTEGNTELGILLGLREDWPQRHRGKPIEQLAAAIADGNGSQACDIALELEALGYTIALFRDSDTALTADQTTKLAAAGVDVFEYGGSLNTEHALLQDGSDDSVQALLEFLRAERGESSVNDAIKAKITDLEIADIQSDFSLWKYRCSRNAAALRDQIAEVTDRKKWFKDQQIARNLAPIVARIARESPSSPLAQTFAQVEAWLYA